MKKKDVLLNYRGGYEGGVRTDIVLGACNSILLYLWDLKEGNKMYKVPPISAIIVQQNGIITNPGA